MCMQLPACMARCAGIYPSAAWHQVSNSQFCAWPLGVCTELVPALVVLCQEHPEPAGRRQLAGLLFSLIKKPNVAQVRLALEPS